MRDIHLRRNEILDPPGKKYWPIYKGRDGCRAPMQWDASANAGFSTVQPWLPVHPDHKERNVAAQQQDPDSLYTFTRDLLHLRKELPALQSGEFIPVMAGRGILAYERKTESQSILVVMNFSNRPAKFGLPPGKWEKRFSSVKEARKSMGLLSPHEVRLIIDRPG